MPPAERREGRPRRSNRKVCAFCVEKIDYIDYKEVSRLRRYLSERGKILPRRVTGTCARHQRTLSSALKRSRHIALLPYTTDLLR
jgi:small subunit ribosomal protein S18